MVSRNLERVNENDGFKMTALEFRIINLIWSLDKNNLVTGVAFYNVSYVK